jgi:hypothetical protein
MLGFHRDLELPNRSCCIVHGLTPVKIMALLYQNIAKQVEGTLGTLHDT